MARKFDRCLKEDDRIKYSSTQKEIYDKLLDKKKREFIGKKCNILNANFDRLEEYEQIHYLSSQKEKRGLQVQIL